MRKDTGNADMEKILFVNACVRSASSACHTAQIVKI